MREKNRITNLWDLNFFQFTLYFESLLQCNYTFKYWVILINYMYLDHKTSHKGKLFESEWINWINSFPLMYGLLW